MARCTFVGYHKGKWRVCDVTTREVISEHGTMTEAQAVKRQMDTTVATVAAQQDSGVAAAQ